MVLFYHWLVNKHWQMSYCWFRRHLQTSSVVVILEDLRLNVPETGRRGGNHFGQVRWLKASVCLKVHVGGLHRVCEPIPLQISDSNIQFIWSVVWIRECMQDSKFSQKLSIFILSTATSVTFCVDKQVQHTTTHVFEEKLSKNVHHFPHLYGSHQWCQQGQQE